MATEAPLYTRITANSKIHSPENIVRHFFIGGSHAEFNWENLIERLPAWSVPSGYGIAQKKRDTSRQAPNPAHQPRAHKRSSVGASGMG